MPISKTWVAAHLLICYAALVHLTWAITLLISASPANITALADLATVGLHHYTLSGICAFAALAALFSDKLTSQLWQVVSLLPQQTLLIFGAWGSLEAIMSGSFADGVKRPVEFLAADQGRNIILLVAHTFAIMCVNKNEHFK